MDALKILDFLGEEGKIYTFYVSPTNFFCFLAMFFKGGKCFCCVVQHGNACSRKVFG